jgi:hypothetical protein
MKAAKSTKEMMVKGSSDVNDLIVDFQNTFPFLKLEILHNGKEASMLYPSTLLSKLTSRRIVKNFRIHDELTVQEVVDLFWENMGLQVCVARKLANSNVETAFTSQWTLKQQNKVGSEVFREFE